MSQQPSPQVSSRTPSVMRVNAAARSAAAQSLTGTNTASPKLGAFNTGSLRERESLSKGGEYGNGSPKVTSMNADYNYNNPANGSPKFTTTNYPRDSPTLRPYNTNLQVSTTYQPTTYSPGHSKTNSPGQSPGLSPYPRPRAAQNLEVALPISQHNSPASGAQPGYANSAPFTTKYDLSPQQQQHSPGQNPRIRASPSAGPSPSPPPPPAPPAATPSPSLGPHHRTGKRGIATPVGGTTPVGGNSPMVGPFGTPKPKLTRTYDVSSQSFNSQEIEQEILRGQYLIESPTSPHAPPPPQQIVPSPPRARGGDTSPLQPQRPLQPTLVLTTEFDEAAQSMFVSTPAAVSHLPSYMARTSVSQNNAANQQSNPPSRRPSVFRSDPLEEAAKAVRDFTDGDTQDSPSPTTPTLRARSLIPNYALGGDTTPPRLALNSSARKKGLNINTNSSEALMRTGSLPVDGSHQHDVGVGGIHTPHASLFDGTSRLPTVPSIDTSSASANHTHHLHNHPSHTSIDLTSPGAVRTLSSNSSPSPSHNSHDQFVNSQKTAGKTVGTIQPAFNPTSPSSSPPVPPTDPKVPRDGVLDRSWWWSILTMGFLGPILAIGNQRTLEQVDVPQLSVKDEPSHVVKLVNSRWLTYVSPAGGRGNSGRSVSRVSSPLLRTLMSCYGWRFFIGFIATAVGRWTMVLSPLFIKEFLVWLQADSGASGTKDGFFFEFGSSSTYYGLEIIGALFVLLIINSVTVNHSYYQGVRMGYAFRAALMSLIFEKALRCSSFTRSESATAGSGGAASGGTGQTVNLMANDTQQIFDACTFVHFTYVEPLLIVITVLVMWWEFGYVAALPAGGLMLILFPIQIMVARMIGRNRSQMVKHTDQRVKVLSEILQGIRVIKFYAWELPMAEKIQAVRVQELACVKYALLLKSFNLLTLFLWPVFVSMVTFIVFVYNGGELTVVKSIEILAFVNVLARPITVLPMALIAVAEVRVSMGRIEKYLLGEELERDGFFLPELTSPHSPTSPMSPVPSEEQRLVAALGPKPYTTPKNTKVKFFEGEHRAQPSVATSVASATAVELGIRSTKGTPARLLAFGDPSLAISVSQASFAWDRSLLSQPALRNLTFQVPKGRLIGIIGSVGSGKTSLFSALLGELVKISGEVRLNGRVAYMTQVAWIQNCSLKDNILFGLPFDPIRYQAAVEAAALATDLLLLPAGDATEIGERGINLSGGQKSRVSLARALYRAEQTELYLLDDPFAAVDVSVGSQMFHSSVGSRGILCDKTRLLILNSHLHLLKFFDEVWVMECAPEGGGFISARGSYEDIERKYPALLAQDRLKRAGSALSDLEEVDEDDGLHEIKEEGSDEFSRGSASTRKKLLTAASSGGGRNRLSQGGSADFNFNTADLAEDGEHQEEEALAFDHKDTQQPHTNGHHRHVSSIANEGGLIPVISDQQFHIPTDEPSADQVFGGGGGGARPHHHAQSSQSFQPIGRGDTFNNAAPTRQGHHQYQASMSNFSEGSPTPRHGRKRSDSFAKQMLARNTTFSVNMLQSQKNGVGLTSPTPVSPPPIHRLTSKKSSNKGNGVSDVSPSNHAGVPPPAPKAPESTSLMTKEDRASGSVGLHLYRYYFDTVALSHVPSLLDVDPATVPKVPQPTLLASVTRRLIPNGTGGLGSLGLDSFKDREGGGNNGVVANGKESKSSTPTHSEHSDEADTPEPPNPVEPIDIEKTKVVSKTVWGIVIFSAILFLFVFCQALRIACDLWLTRWGDEQANVTTAKKNGTTLPLEHSHLYWVYGCAIVTGAAFIFVAFRAYLFVSLALRASNKLHRILLRRLLIAPITTFYDVTPLGRILNRLSKDMDQLDSFLPDLLSQFIQHSFNLIGGLIVSIVSTPWFGLVLLPIFFVFFRLQAYFRVSSRELKRLEGITRSPIFSTFSETLLGLSTIRAYRAESAFIQKQRLAIRSNSKIYATFYLTSRWLSLRLDLISNFLVLAVGLFGIFLKGGSLDSALVGLALLYTLQFTGFLQWTVRVSVDTENSMTSVERLSHYEHLPSEAAYVVPATQAAPRNWPSKGEIIFRDLKLRYRPELPLVLRGVSATIRPREKIGICGRTGSGKSSLMVSLFRIVECAPGSILIDGIDIGLIGLKEVRSSISIIPQDPVMFSGTIRYNLDPFNERTDAAIWTVLTQVSMKAYVSGLTLGLESHVSEYGDNFSQGQKQLFCIARALLRQSRIIVLDEATAAVDNETDALIQKTIRESFAECTVLTIAHRLNTIMDSTRVMVLDKGYLAEFDTPQNLLEKPGGLFAAMVQTADGVSNE